MPELLRCLLPPTASDELTHHLALPQLWLRTGEIRPIQGITVSYFPAWTEVLYAGGLLLNQEALARIIHFLLGLLVLLIPACWTTPAGPWTFLALAALWLTTPAFYALLGIAYSDLGCLAALLGAFFLWKQWMEERERRLLIFASALTGLSVAIKYSALPAAVVLLGMSFLEILSRRKKEGLSAYGDLPCLLAAAIAPLPHFVINGMTTGNPLYPLLQAVFGGPEAATGLPLGHWEIRELFYGESLLLRLLVPLRIYWTGLSGSQERFDGVINPLWLFWPLLFLWSKEGKSQRIEIRLALAWAAISLITFLTASPRARYYLPALAPLAVLFVEKFPAIEWTPKRKRAALALAVLGGLFGLVHNGREIVRSGLFPYLSGAQGREAYLQEHVPEYAALEAAREHLPGNAVVYPILAGNRFYYIGRQVRLDSGFLPDILKTVIGESESASDAARAFQKLGISHLLFPPSQLAATLRAELTGPQWAVSSEFFETKCVPISQKGAFTLCAIAPDS
ncbi:MAG: hypothetical protein AB1405_04735 [Bdellovibrionota bacterium]